MSITTGDTLPDATLLRMGADGPEQVQLHDLTSGKKVVVFGLPGAFTGTCTSASTRRPPRTAGSKVHWRTASTAAWSRSREPLRRTTSTLAGRPSTPTVAPTRTVPSSRLRYASTG